MLDKTAFVRGCAVALNAVFDAGTLEAHATLTQGVATLEKEEAVASIRFYGDFRGRAVLMLDAQSLEKAETLISRKYALDTPVKKQAVFSEMMNIYAGRLIVELSREGIDIQIDPPDAQARLPAMPPDSTWTLRMPTREGLAFVVCHTIEHEDANR